MVVDVLGEKDDVVQVLPERLPLEDRNFDIDGLLKHGRGFCESEDNPEKLVDATVTKEARFEFVFPVLTDMPVPVVAVNCCEDAGISERVDAFIHPWKWKGVLSSEEVESPVVDVEAGYLIPLGDNDHRNSPFRH